MSKLRLLLMGLAVAGLAVNGGSYAKPDKAQNPHGGNSDKAQDKSQKPHGGNAKSPKGQKGHKHLNGKEMIGEKIKSNGKHKVRQNGKFAESVTVQNGKIAGFEVKDEDKGGDVPVTKYKTTKKMAQRETSGIYLASLYLAQDQYLGTTYIGFAYIDDYGDEIIEWFPYDMILNGDTGAIEYYEVPE